MTDHPDEDQAADVALLTGEELLALIAGALIRQQQEVGEPTPPAATRREGSHVMNELDQLEAAADPDRHHDGSREDIR
jgi:hypothetical protein